MEAGEWYTLLQPGDIIEDGDEFRFCGGWCKTLNVGMRWNPDDFKPMRRKANMLVTNSDTIGVALTEKSNNMANENLPTHREHRTALVIDVRNGVTGDYANRYGRLLESLNGDNIKVDIFTLRANAVQSGPALVAGSPNETVAPDVQEQEIDLHAWAADLGYTQLLVSIPVQVG